MVEVNNTYNCSWDGWDISEYDAIYPRYPPC